MRFPGRAWRSRESRLERQLVAHAMHGNQMFGVCRAVVKLLAELDDHLVRARCARSFGSR